ncbi:MAG: hypothetical protein RLZZ305_424 [Actinomycetota bacterium]
MRSLGATELARLAVALDVPAWDELHRRFSPVFVLWARRYCNQIAHRMPPRSRSRHACTAQECERAFWPAYEALLLHVLGDRPMDGTRDRRGRIDEWADRDLANEEFSESVTRALSGGGRMTDVFRLWCASIGVPQRARVPAGTDGPLRAAISAHVAEIFPGLPTDAASRLVDPGAWLDALHWDAAQAGLSHDIDADRVHRAVADGDEDLVALDGSSFARLCWMVDDSVATIAPSFHAEYLSKAREITRVPVDLEQLSENELAEFEDRGGWV